MIENIAHLVNQPLLQTVVTQKGPDAANRAPRIYVLDSTWILIGLELREAHFKHRKTTQSFDERDHNHDKVATRPQNSWKMLGPGLLAPTDASRSRCGWDDIGRARHSKSWSQLAVYSSIADDLAALLSNGPPALG